MANPFLGGLLGAGLGAIGGIIGERSSRRARRRQREAINLARTTARAESDRILADPLIQQSREFLESSFADPASTPLARDLVAGIRAGQSVRGTFAGNAGALAEAAAVSGFSQRLRESLLDDNIRFATLGNDLFSSILQREAPLMVAQATGAQIFGAPNMQSQAAGAIGQGISGFGGGFNLASQFNQSQADLELTQARTNQARAEIGAVPAATDSEALLRAQGIDPNLLQQILSPTLTLGPVGIGPQGGF